MTDKPKSAPQKGESVVPDYGKVGDPFDLTKQPKTQPSPTGQRAVHSPGEIPPMPHPPEDEILNHPRNKKS